MILTFQITDDEWSALKELLKIGANDFDTLVQSQQDSSIIRDRLASRIIHARKVLKLSVHKSDCCYDYKP